MRTVQPYEVELTVKQPGQPLRLIMRVEYAYSPQDAFVIATLNATVGQPNGTVIDLHHIGPPRKLVEAATQELMVRIAQRVASLAG